MTRCTLDVLNPHKTPKPDFLRYFICTSARLQTSWEFRTLYISCMECKEGSTLIKLDRPQETFKCSIAANIWFYLRSNQATIQQRLSNVLGPHLNCHTLRAAVQHGTWSCALRSHQVVLCKCLTVETRTVLMFISITWSHLYRPCICLHLASISNSSRDTSDNISGLERKKMWREDHTDKDCTNIKVVLSGPL